MDRLLFFLALLGIPACGLDRSRHEAGRDGDHGATGFQGGGPFIGARSMEPPDLRRTPCTGPAGFTVQVDPRCTEVAITVSDAEGQVVLRKRAQSGTSGSVRIDLASSVAPGVYLVRCDDGASITGHHVVVQ